MISFLGTKYWLLGNSERYIEKYVNYAIFPHSTRLCDFTRCLKLAVLYEFDDHKCNKKCVVSLKKIRN